MSTSSNQTETYDFQSLSVEELFKKPAASSKGLSAEEASKRLKDYGYNEIAAILSAVVYYWADCGIAVSGATDAARSAADIVLTLPGLSVIIDAIKKSRKIFQRMNNYSIYRRG